MSAHGNLDVSSAEVAAVFDDLPVWAAPFGLRLLDAVRLRPGLTALDVGCGAGFPLVELAERLGRTSRVHGVDPWPAALARARAKLAVRGVYHVTLHEGVAERLPLADETVDLVVSNNGLNNVADAAQALAECARVARPGAQLVATWNLPDSMHELYAAMQPVLGRRVGDAEAARRIGAHVAARRESVATWRARLAVAGFAVEHVVLDQVVFAFADAAALFDHWFMRLAFVGPWGDLADPADRADVLAEVARELDRSAAPRGGVRLTVPFACVDARRV